MSEPNSIVGASSNVGLDAIRVGLTLEEKLVAYWLLQGLETPEIAMKMNFTPQNVKHHLRKIYKKFGITHGVKRIRLAVALYPFREALHA